MENHFGLYIHIPFCSSKCSYCALYSGVFDEDLHAKFFLKLHREISSKASIYKDRIIDSIYLGGGTPSLVDEKYIVATLELVRKLFVLSTDCEISIEANPESLTEDKFSTYISSGVNRISMGVQVYDDKFLDFLHRGTRVEDVDNAISLLQRKGFKNFNLDTMYALPGLSNEVLHKTLDKIITSNPAHVSIYTYSQEKATLLGNMIERGKLELPSDIEVIEQNKIVFESISDAGYTQYEISNFSKKGFECNHNLNFWKGSEYVGFGPSAVSFVDGSFFENKPDIKRYILNEDFEVETTETSFEDRLEKNLLLGARLIEGFDLRSVYETAKQGRTENETSYESFEKSIIPSLVVLANEKLMSSKNGVYSLTYEGLLKFDYVASKLLLQ
jgi:oxygen-independent coproporphyrinogen-3 oxidase